MFEHALPVAFKLGDPSLTVHFSQGEFVTR
jgi:hypothetical protein